jgi:hypothetical protein
MSTQYENVSVVIGGANPQTLSVTVPVNTTTGAGSATFSYKGTAGGSDSLQGTASIAGNNYTSNSASVSWQPTSGAIQIGSVVTAYAWGDSPTSGPVAAYIWKNPSDSGWGTSRVISSAPYTATNNSLLFSGGSGTYSVWSTFNAAGQAVGGQSFPPFNSDNNTIIMGNLLIPAPGTYTLNITYKDGVNWGIGASATGAVPTWANKGSIQGDASQTMTVNGGYPLLPAPQINGDGGYVGSSTPSVTFTQAGVYPIEINWDYWHNAGRQLHVTSPSNGVAGTGELAPITLVSAPPSSTPTGNLTITPAGGPTNLQIVGQSITLTVNVSGIVYSTKSYVPVLEGVTGYLDIYNDSSNPVFNFQTYNGQSVNKTAAGNSIFSLSSTDNTAYQGLFSVGYDGSSNFTLSYNGTTANPTADSRVVSTELVITAEDIAWYNGNNQSFDLYTVSGSTGGSSLNLEVDYMNSPTFSSLSPDAVGANGEVYVLTVYLSKAFSPQQQGANNTGNSVNCSITIVGAAGNTVQPTPVLDSNGWLTGWTVPFTSPGSTTNQTLQVYMEVTGTLTYLSGNTFVTNTITYISEAEPVGTITATGTSFSGPVTLDLTVTPTPPSLALSTDDTTQYSMVATVFTTDDYSQTTCAFFMQPVDGGIGFQWAPIGPTSVSSYTLSGITGTLLTFIGGTFSGSSDYIDASGDYLGYIITDAISGLGNNWVGTDIYTSYNPDNEE